MQALPDQVVCFSKIFWIPVDVRNHGILATAMAEPQGRSARLFICASHVFHSAVVKPVAFAGRLRDIGRKKRTRALRRPGLFGAAMAASSRVPPYRTRPKALVFAITPNKSLIASGLASVNCGPMGTGGAGSVGAGPAATRRRARRPNRNYEFRTARSDPSSVPQFCGAGKEACLAMIILPSQQVLGRGTVRPT